MYDLQTFSSILVVFFYTQSLHSLTNGGWAAGVLRHMKPNLGMGIPSQLAHGGPHGFTEPQEPLAWLLRSLLHFFLCLLCFIEPSKGLILLFNNF
jgi:hypothetical protein